MLADNTHSTDLRRSLTVRDNGGGSGGPSLADRPPVKQRLSLPSNGKALRTNQGTSTGSSHLQDIEIQYFEEIMEPPRLSNNRPSGSRPPGTLHSPMEQISPIRSLSEDRRHVTLRLGPQPVENQQNSPIQAGLSDGQGIVTRSVAKRKKGKAPPKKRYNPSPVNGISLKKRRVAKTQNSPRRRTQASNTATTQRKGTPKANIIPAISKKNKDFRAEPSALP